MWYVGSLRDQLILDADLPVLRVSEDPPVIHTGLNFAGHFVFKD